MEKFLNHLFSGFKTTIVSGCFISILFFLFTFNVLPLPAWQVDWLNVLFVTSIIVVVFSGQFNQSRFALLILLFLTFHLSNTNLISIPFITGFLFDWQNNTNWQFLSGLLALTFLAYAKDRSLLSVHVFYRVLIFLSCIVFAYLWLLSFEWLSFKYKSEFVEFPYISWAEIYFPMAICVLLLVYKSLRLQALFQPAVLVSAVIWCLYFLDLWALSWTMTLIFLSLYYLLSVIVSSYFLAYRDELTGLASRRALFQLSLSLGRNYSVAMMDIDHFKKFNDTYGHDIGDQVLRLVASKLTNVKLGGRVFRYGGEEFTIIFFRKTTEQVFDELDRVRQLIADYKMVIRQPHRKGKTARNDGKSTQKSVSVTISIGLAQRYKKQSFEQVMKVADEKLYQAKNKGRNNVSQ